MLDNTINMVMVSDWRGGVIQSAYRANDKHDNDGGGWLNGHCIYIIKGV